MTDRLEEIRAKWNRHRCRSTEYKLIRADIEYLLSLLDTEVVEVKGKEDCPARHSGDCKVLELATDNVFECRSSFFNSNCPLKTKPITIKLGEIT